MSKKPCAMCGYELEIPNGVDVPEDCDVVCGDCGESLQMYLDGKVVDENTKLPETTLH